MKRMYIVLIIAVIGLLLTACNDQNLEPTEPYPEIHTNLTENYEDNELEPYITDPTDTPTTPYTLVETDEGIQRIFPPGTLTIEHFLEDIDSMMYILENNFALLDVAYWAWDVEAWALADNVRADVIAAYEAGILCENRYLALLRINFFPLLGTGHFDIFTPGRYQSMVTNPYGGYRSLVTAENIRLLETPLALRFYEHRVRDLNYFGDVHIEVLNETEAVYNRFFGTHLEWMRGRVPRHDGNVYTKVIEDGRIGYISVQSFAGNLHADEHTRVIEFYREIRDFEHLIIDLRGNQGGSISYALSTLFHPHLSEMVEVNSFHFFIDGPYIRKHGENIFARTSSNGNLIIPVDYRPLSEIFEEYYFSDKRIQDFDRLDYGIASGTGRIHPRSGEDAFAGKIWLLTDNRMMSAATQFAWISMETGFATHVGETTGGGLGGLRTLALLPNTGIAIYFDVFYITDERGRPLEAGTIPHHFNREGMDALETVLALIAEGEY